MYLYFNEGNFSLLVDVVLYLGNISKREQNRSKMTAYTRTCIKINRMRHVNEAKLPSHDYEISANQLTIQLTEC